MAKYDALGRHLRKRRGAEIRLTFNDIECIMQALLPKATGHPCWWSSEPSRGRWFIQCRAWLGDSFHAEAVGHEEFGLQIR